eukprot:gene4234-7571_t
MKTILLFLLFVQFSYQIIQLEGDFEAKIFFHSRSDPTVNYVGVIQKTKQFGIQMIVEDNNKMKHYYSNGRLTQEIQSITGDKRTFCVSIESTPPTPNFSLIKNYIQKNIIYDKEVNYCTGEKYLIPYEGEQYVLCTNKGRIQKVIGHNVIVEVLSYSTDINDFLDVKLSEKCAKNKKENGVDVQENWFEQKDTCNFKWLRDERYCPKLLPTKHCFFFHGSGEQKTEEPSDNFEQYWGKLNNFTPQCKLRTYIKEETLLRGFESQSLQKKYCDYLTFNNDTLIKNKIIFTHSMGGLILASAIKNKYCEIDSTSKWFIVSTPFQGSHVVPFIKNVCEEKLPGLLPRVKKIVVEYFGYCVPKQKKVWPVYESLNLNYTGMKEALEISKTRISGSMCGNSSFGLTSADSLPLTIVTQFCNFSSPNDGLCSIYSCNDVGGSNQYQYQPNANFYQPQTNHPDMTCRHGDGLWGSHRKPCTWFANKT